VASIGTRPTTLRSSRIRGSLTEGARIPILGFGAWQLKGDDAVRATSSALENGYRHLDTATVYGNEAEVGRALADSGVPREDVFLTTKPARQRRPGARYPPEEPGAAADR
jgi:diketogulonate reductase-like aldo/keto reductase